MCIEDLKREFENFYGKGEVRVYFAPGRVNLIGEHTDYNGGVVFPCALSFGTYILIRKTNQNSFRFRSLNQDSIHKINIDSLCIPLPEGTWVNYALGVLAQFVKNGQEFDAGADLLIWGNVPNGAGLSSSASLELATGIAVNDLYNFGNDQLTLVKYGQKAEHEFVGVFCGIMDQFASGMGKKDHAIYLNCDSLDYELVPVKMDGVQIIIANSNSPHSLDEGKYNERVAECQAAVEAISAETKISSLGELTTETFNRVETCIANETVKRRAQHVVTEIERTKRAVFSLKKGDLTAFGELMRQSHNSLRYNYEVTGKELDTLVEAAEKIKGTIGARMTGGGFGGSTVNLVKEECSAEFIEKVGKEYTEKTGLVADFYIAKIGDGGKRIE